MLCIKITGVAVGWCRGDAAMRNDVCSVLVICCKFSLPWTLNVWHAVFQIPLFLLSFCSVREEFLDPLCCGCCKFLLVPIFCSWLLVAVRPCRERPPSSIHCLEVTQLHTQGDCILLQQCCKSSVLTYQSCACPRALTGLIPSGSSLREVVFPSTWPVYRICALEFSSMLLLKSLLLERCRCWYSEDIPSAKALLCSVLPPLQTDGHWLLAACQPFCMPAIWILHCW